jgi:ligand-binding sensor domain-containing protein
MHIRETNFYGISYNMNIFTFMIFTGLIGKYFFSGMLFRITMLTPMNKVIIILLLLFSETIYAQKPEWIYYSKHISINSFAEEDNYIWMGGYAGALKIDKTTGVNTFFDKSTCPISDNWINKIVIDKNGVKWFASQEGGIAKLNGNKWMIYDTSNTPLPCQTIRDFTVDSKNNLWIITSNNQGELIKFDGTTWTLFNDLNSGLPDNYMDCIYSVGDNIWLGTSGGLTKFDGSNWTTFNTTNSDISGETFSKSKVIKTEISGYCIMGDWKSSTGIILLFLTQRIQIFPI